MKKNTLIEYWYVLYDRRRMSLVIAFSTVVTVFILSKVIHPVYEAKAVFFVPKEPDVATFLAPPGENMARVPYAPPVTEETFGPYIGILKTATIAQLVQRDFPHKKVRDLMQRDISFELSDEYLLNVYARDKNPALAAGIANAYVKYFRKLMDGYSLKSQLDRQTTLEEDIEVNQKRLSRAKYVLTVFQQKHKTANLDEETKQLIAMKTNFETNLKNMQIKHSENKNKILATKRKLKDEIHAFRVSELVITSPLLEKLKAQLVDIEAKMASLRVEIKESHPEYIILKRNYEEVKKSVNKEIENILESQIKAPDTFCESLRRQLINLYVEKEGIEANISGTEKTLTGIDKRMREISILQDQLDNLATRVERYKKIVETLSFNLQEVNAQSKRAPLVAIQVEQATPPTKPAFPVMWLNLIVGFLVGIVGGVFYCFFMNYLEETRGVRLYRLLKAIKATEGEA